MTCGSAVARMWAGVRHYSCGVCAIIPGVSQIWGALPDLEAHNLNDLGLLEPNSLLNRIGNFFGRTGNYFRTTGSSAALYQYLLLTRSSVNPGGSRSGGDEQGTENAKPVSPGRRMP
jgi:hypothetical protein